MFYKVAITSENFIVTIFTIHAKNYASAVAQAFHSYGSTPYTVDYGIVDSQLIAV